MAYLDDKGLAYLWGKVTGRSPPIKALAQAEYDALTEEEKQRDVLYLITDQEAPISKEYVNDLISARLDAIRISVSHELGSVVSWAGHRWVVAHAESDRIVLAGEEIYDLSSFGSTSVYEGSALAAHAKSFEDSLPAAALEDALETTVNGVSGRIFAASYEQLNGGFAYFDSDQKRVCYLDSGEAGGRAPFAWWTSSAYNYVAGLLDREAYLVNANGSMSNGGIRTTASRGFRPFVTLKI